MISVRSNTSQVIAKVLARVQATVNNDTLLRTLATNQRAAMKVRIHVDGLDAQDKPIGTYSKSYMTVRTGAYKNAKKTKSGKIKSAGVYTERTIRVNKQNGVFTGEDKVGKARPMYNRTTDTKVVASLTRQMENDMVVVPTAKGYGIGYNNPENYKKAGYVEATYRKSIFKVSPKERVMLINTAKEIAGQNNA